MRHNFMSLLFFVLCVAATLVFSSQKDGEADQQQQQHDLTHYQSDYKIKDVGCSFADPTTDFTDENFDDSNFDDLVHAGNREADAEEDEKHGGDDASTAAKSARMEQQEQAQQQDDFSDLDEPSELELLLMKEEKERNERRRQQDEKQQQQNSQQATSESSSSSSASDNREDYADSRSEVRHDHKMHQQQQKQQEKTTSKPSKFEQRRKQREEAEDYSDVKQGGDDGDGGDSQHKDGDSNHKVEPLLLVWYAPFLGYSGYGSEALEFSSAIWRALLPAFNYSSTTPRPDVSHARQRYEANFARLSTWMPRDEGAILDSSGDVVPMQQSATNKKKNQKHNKPLAVRAFGCFHHGDSAKHQTPDYHTEEYRACLSTAAGLALNTPVSPDLWPPGNISQVHPSRIVVVCHSNQGMWSLPRPDYANIACPPQVHPVRARIGRTMFETDRLPLMWKRRLLQMDEIWVPTEFHRLAFSRPDWPGSIPYEKMRVVPEPIDTELWRMDDSEFGAIYSAEFGFSNFRVPTEHRNTRNRLAYLSALSGVDITPLDMSDPRNDPGPSLDRIPGHTDNDPEDDDDADERVRPRLAVRDTVLRSLRSYRVGSKQVMRKGGSCLNGRVFVSTFKRERRKGWDILVRAYLEAFQMITPGKDYPMCLILHTTEYAEEIPLDFAATIDLFVDFLYSERDVSVEEQQAIHDRDADLVRIQVEARKRQVQMRLMQLQMQAIRSRGGNGYSQLEMQQLREEIEQEMKDSVQQLPDRVSAAKMALHQRDEMARELSDPRRVISYRELCRGMCVKESCTVCDEIRIGDSGAAAATAAFRSFMRARIASGDTPLLLFTDGPLSFQDYKNLIQVSDVSVLTTRGEGWGRPVQEAMALAVPYIVTNWSGPVAFSRPEFSFLIPIDEATQLRTVPDDLWFAGHKWAEPSVDDVRKSLVKAEAMALGDLKRMGGAAREYVVEHLDVSVIGQQVLDAVAEIAGEVEFKP